MTDNLSKHIESLVCFYTSYRLDDPMVLFRRSFVVMFFLVKVKYHGTCNGSDMDSFFLGNYLSSTWLR